MKINMEKLELAIKKEIPNGFFGYFEPREDYNKLVAYGKVNGQDQTFTWVHKEYQR